MGKKSKKNKSTPSKKIKKKKVNIKLITILLSSFLIITVIHHISKAPVTILPYPYVIKINSFSGAEEASSSDILIIGDRMGVKLNDYIAKINEKASARLRNPLNIYNWSRNNEGLHRTLAKVKSLKRIPPVVIYQGSSQEFYEQKFFIKERGKILDNFEKYNDDYLGSLLITFPITSILIYKPVKRVAINKLTRNENVYSSKLKMKQMELIYRIYSVELQELIDTIRARKSNLISITTPINLDIPPKRICENSTSPEIDNFLKEIETLIKNSKNKEAYKKLQKLNENIIGHSKLIYLLGQVTAKFGKFSEAISLLQKSATFDCSSWRSNSVFNSIIRYTSASNGIHMIDFDNVVNSQYGSNELFWDQLYPQHIYYNQVIDKITDLTISILKL